MIEQARPYVNELIHKRLLQLAESVIAELKSLGRDSCLSPPDYELHSVWEEIEYQQKNGEYSFDWDVYVEVVEGVAWSVLEGLSRFELSILWFETDAYIDWDEDDDQPPVCVHDVKSLLSSIVLRIAGGYEGVLAVVGP